jgi:hypothetical protein
MGGIVAVRLPVEEYVQNASHFPAWEGLALADVRHTIWLPL